VVPADGEMTSQSAIGGNVYLGSAAFTATRWSVVLAVQGPSPAAQEALEKPGSTLGICHENHRAD